MRLALLTSILFTVGAQSQDLRPLTRVGPKSTLVVAEAHELFPGIERGQQVYTAVMRGAVRHDTVQRYVRFTPTLAAGDWQHQLAAKLDHPVEAGTVYLPGAVRGLQPFLPEKRHIYFWGGDTLDPALPTDGQAVRCIWRPDGYGDRTLVVHEFDVQETVQSERAFHVRRTGCEASQRDSIAVVRCAPDPGHADTEPATVLVMVNGQLVQFWIEPADAARRELLAVRGANGNGTLVFSTGDVLHFEKGQWRLERAAISERGTQLAQQR